MRLELQSEKGDTQILYDGHTVSLYDAATNTLYRYTPPRRRSGELEHRRSPTVDPITKSPRVAKIEEAISHLSRHADVSGATPTDVAGQPAYTVRVSPKEGGSLFGGAELSFDADHGVPLRAAIYSSTSSAPVIELAATEISYGPVADSVFEVTPPAGAKIKEITPPSTRRRRRTRSHGRPGEASSPASPPSGHGPRPIAVLESKAKAGTQKHRRTARRPAQGHDQRRQRQRAAHRARHAAQVRARRRALPARRRRHARRDRSGRARPLA